MIVEGDGRKWHSKVSDFQRDRERDVAAARVGYITLRFTWDQINNNPAEVCAAVREVLASRAHLIPRQ